MDKKTYNLVQGKKYFLNGEEKTQWIKIGKLFTKMDIPSSVKLDALPLPDDKGEVWLKVFPEDFLDKQAFKKEEVIDTSDATLENDLGEPKEEETKVDDDEIPF